jgi:hypothetical protein
LILGIPDSDLVPITADGDVGVTPEVADLVAENVIRDQPSDVWRSSGSGERWLDFHMASLTPAGGSDCIWVGYHNGGFAPAGLEISWGTTQGASNVRFETTQLTQGFDFRGYSLHHAFFDAGAGQIGSWVRLNFIAGYPDPFDVGRVMIGQAWRPTRGMRYGSTVTWVEDGDRVRSLQGGLFTRSKGKHRVVQFTLDMDTEDEAHVQSYLLDRVAGTTKSVLWVDRPEDTTYFMDRCIYGVLSSEPHVNRPRGRVRKSYTIEERELP